MLVTGTCSAGCSQCPWTGWRSHRTAHLDPEIAAVIDTVDVRKRVENFIPHPWTKRRETKNVNAAVPKKEVIVRSWRGIQSNINAQVYSLTAIPLARSYVKPRIATPSRNGACSAGVHIYVYRTERDCCCAVRDTHIRAGRDVRCDDAVKCLTAWLIGVAHHQRPPTSGNLDSDISPPATAQLSDPL